MNQLELVAKQLTEVEKKISWLRNRGLTVPESMHNEVLGYREILYRHKQRTNVRVVASNGNR